MSVPILNQLCLAPTLVEGIYNACDQWCMYCPATARCLVLRCSPEIASGKHDLYALIAVKIYRALAASAVVREGLE